MSKRKQSPILVQALLNDPKVRRVYHEGLAYYSATDLIRVLAETESELWSDVKRREPALAQAEEVLEYESEGQIEAIATLDLPGVFRLIQAVSSPTAEKLKRWLAE